jgi:hypothetical protein
LSRRHRARPEIARRLVGRLGEGLQSRLKVPRLPLPGLSTPDTRPGKEGRSEPEVAQQKKSAKVRGEASCKWPVLPTHAPGVPPCRAVGSCRTDKVQCLWCCNIPHMRCLVELASIQYRRGVWMGKATETDWIHAARSFRSPTWVFMPSHGDAPTAPGLSCWPESRRDVWRPYMLPQTHGSRTVKGPFSCRTFCCLCNSHVSRQPGVVCLPLTSTTPRREAHGVLASVQQ